LLPDEENVSRFRERRKEGVEGSEKTLALGSSANIASNRSSAGVWTGAMGVLRGNLAPLEQGVSYDRDPDKVQRRRPGYVILTTNLLIALSWVWRVATDFALVCLYTICSHPYEHERYISFQYQHL
jgi:hypothetical protein